jgi:hypothetical protein
VAEDTKKKKKLTGTERGILGGAGGAGIGATLFVVIYLIVRNVKKNEERHADDERFFQGYANSPDEKTRVVALEGMRINDDIHSIQWGTEVVVPALIGAAAGVIGATLLALAWTTIPLWAAICIGIGLALLVASLIGFGLQAYDEWKLRKAKEELTTATELEPEATATLGGEGAEGVDGSGDMMTADAPSQGEGTQLPTSKKRKKKKSAAQTLVDEITKLTEVPLYEDKAAVA